MSVAGVSLLVLPAIFIIGTVWPISIGVVSFAATFVVGILIAGIPAEGLFALFPADIFVLLAGITYMFSVARQNGTMAVITEAAVRLVRGRVAVIPWIFHALAIVFSAMGAGPAAATAVLIPVALGVAQQAKISPLLMGIMVIHGSHAGSMSPLSPIGALVNGAAATAKLPDSSGTVFVSSLLFNITLALTAYLLLGGVGLMRRGSESIRIGPARAKEPMEGHGSPSTLGTVLATQESTTVSAPATLRPQHLATLAGIAALVVLGVGFQFNVGLSAFAVGLLLTAMAPKQDTHAVASMSWSTMLMLSGVMTYIGLVTKVGGMRLLSDALLGAGSPVLAVLLIAFVAALTSLFSATGAVVGALVPVLGAVLGAHASVPAAGALSGVAISSSVVDSSPLSLQGAVLLANVEEHQRRPLFRRLMAWGAAMVVVGSAVPLLLFVLLPMWLG